MEERTRIAREIHDVLAHSLGALAGQLDVTEALLADGADNAVLTRMSRGPAAGTEMLVNWGVLTGEPPSATH